MESKWLMRKAPTAIDKQLCYVNGCYGKSMVAMKINSCYQKTINNMGSQLVLWKFMVVM
jgi:hypothetical protein